jgi:hypothetical protein
LLHLLRSALALNGGPLRFSLRAGIAGAADLNPHRPIHANSDILQSDPYAAEALAIT